MQHEWDIHPYQNAKKLNHHPRPSRDGYMGFCHKNGRPLRKKSLVILMTQTYRQTTSFTLVLFVKYVTQLISLEITSYFYVYLIRFMRQRRVSRQQMLRGGPARPTALCVVQRHQLSGSVPGRVRVWRRRCDVRDPVSTPPDVLLQRQHHPCCLPGQMWQ